jgi:hypothetical protein
MGLANGGTPQSTSNSDGTEGGNPVPNMPEGGYYTTTTLTIAESYDGDGRSLKRVETKVQGTPFYQPVTTERVDYYLRSTVLGGKVLTELTSQGQKRKTNVYVGSEVAAEQILSGQNQWLVWKYRNPVTATSAEQTGTSVTKQEYDPWGLELGASDPYLQSEEPDYAMLAGGSFYRNGGNPFDGDSGCQWNGMPFPCARLDYVLRTQNVERIEIISRDPGFASGFRAYTVHQAVRIRVREFNEDTGQPGEIISDWSIGDVIDSSVFGLQTFHHAVRQDTRVTTIDPAGIRDALDRMLRKGGCGTFIKELINRLASPTKNPSISNSALDLFDFVDKGKGGFVRGGLADKQRVSATVKGHIRSGNAAIHINSNFDGVFDPQVEAKSIIANDAFSTLHELVHHAGSKDYYDDIQIAQTLSKWLGVPGVPVRKKGESIRDFIGRNSSYFSGVLRDKCPTLNVVGNQFR